MMRLTSRLFVCVSRSSDAVFFERRSALLMPGGFWYVRDIGRDGMLSWRRLHR